MELSQSDITVRFVCNICQDSVTTINDFISHKKLLHFADFQKRKFIVFEEKLSNNIGADLNKVLASDTHQQKISDVVYVPVNPEFDEFVEFEDESEHEINISELHPDQSSTSLPMPLSAVEIKSELQNQTINSISSSTRTYFQSCSQEITEVSASLDFLTDAEFNDDIKVYNEENFQSVKSQSYNEEIIMLEPPSSSSFIAEGSDKKPILDFEDLAEDPLSCKNEARLALNPVFCIQRLNSKETQNTKWSQVIPSTCKKGQKIEVDLEIETKPMTERSNIATYNTQKHSNNSQLLSQYQCPLCKKLFDSEPHLRIHREICQLYKKNAANELKYECGVCRRKFKNSQGLKYHKWSIHNNLDVVAISSKAIMCSHPGCSRTFENARDLNIHKALAHVLPSELKYVCKENSCGKAFKRKDYLNKHIQEKHRKNTNLPVFTCEICYKTFPARRFLHSHSLVHSDFKPFKCIVNGCNAAFKRKQCLERHGMSHNRDCDPKR